MKRDTHSVWLWFALVGMLLLALVIPARAWAHGPAEGGANADTIEDLFFITLWIALPIFILVEGLILFAIIRYRRRSAEETPEQKHGNTLLEVTWTILAFAIVAVLFVLTVRALQTDYEVDAGDTTPDFTIEVIGYMWKWDFKYYVGDSDMPGVRTTTNMKIPTNKNVLLKITSTDVQHSFWVPDLAGKVDAIPGYTNTMWLNVNDDKIGTHIGNCAEYCGTLHYDMLIQAEVVTPEEFDTWLAKEEAALGEFIPMGVDMDAQLPPGYAERGEETFEQWCTSCHGGGGTLGPPLSGMWDRAATRRAGTTAEEYLRESILDPCAYEVDDYNCTFMPNDYGERLDVQGLADLIEHIRQASEQQE